MEIVYERISVPEKQSFISRKIELDYNDHQIHSHKNFELNMIISGVGRRIVGDNISNFKNNDLVLLGPNLAHSWELLDKEKNETPTSITTHFYENIVDTDIFRIPELNSIKELLNQANVGIQFKGKKLVQIRKEIEILANLKGLDKYIQLLKVFNHLLHFDNIEFLSLKTEHNPKLDKDKEKLNKVYEFVFTNIQEGIILKEVASHVAMAPTSFCRYFKKKTNSPFMQYVKNVRIKMATKMLIETDKTITQICYDCGYKNLANFNHYFKETTGKTPSEYRRCFE
ncbi:MAG: AraC family transcriptional regulator [Bacteroidota bacterium]